MAAALAALFAWIALTANVGLFAGTGIECGWQPMPDGTPSYECVVQVAPELLNALRRGDSIPLTVDVPEHIRPISRIRLVANNETVPHETLAQNLKSWPEAEKKPRDGVVETQFTTSNGDPRYNSQQATDGAVVPLNGYMNSAQDAVARQLQNGGQAIREAAGQMAQDVLPPDPGRSVANAIDRAGNELGNNLRNASDSVQNDIRQLFGNDPIAGNGSEILPPSGQQPSALNNQQSQLIPPGNSNTADNNRRRLDQPLNPVQGNNWQSSQPLTNSTKGSNSISPPGSFDNQWAGDTRPQSPPAGNSNAAPVGDRYGSAPPFTNPATVLPQNNTPIGGDQTDRVGNGGQTASADSRNGSLGGSQAAGAGPSFPAFTPSLGGEQSPITPTPMTSSSTPEIRREMLSQPANAEIQGANGQPIGQVPISATQVATQAPQTPGTSATNSFNWNTKPQAQQNTLSQMATLPDSSSNSVFPLLLSWVLLSGSGAGNLYLFWSYLDVRNKYRDLVDDASRRISGRRTRD